MIKDDQKAYLDYILDHFYETYNLDKESKLDDNEFFALVAKINNYFKEEKVITLSQRTLAEELWAIIYDLLGYEAMLQYNKRVDVKVIKGVNDKKYEGSEFE